MEAARLDSHTQETLSAPAVEAALALAEQPEALLDKREELGEECQRADWKEHRGVHKRAQREREQGDAAAVTGAGRAKGAQ